jgi:hypothetical protein
MLSLKTGMSNNPINPPTLSRGAQIGGNVKFLLTLTYKTEIGREVIDV